MRKALEYTDLTDRILACAIAVHKSLGPGFPEKLYEEALCLELVRNRLLFERQKVIRIFYRQRQIGIHRLDLIVEQKIIIELKAVNRLEDVHYAIALSYLKAAQLPIALLLNFAAPSLYIRRFGNSVLKTKETGNTGSGEGIVRFLRKEDS